MEEEEDMIPDDELLLFSSLKEEEEGSSSEEEKIIMSTTAASTTNEEEDDSCNNNNNNNNNNSSNNNNTLMEQNDEDLVLVDSDASPPSPSPDHDDLLLDTVTNCIEDEFEVYSYLVRKDDVDRLGANDDNDDSSLLLKCMNTSVGPTDDDDDNDGEKKEEGRKSHVLDESFEVTDEDHFDKVGVEPSNYDDYKIFDGLVTPDRHWQQVVQKEVVPEAQQSTGLAYLTQTISASLGFSDIVQNTDSPCEAPNTPSTLTTRSIFPAHCAYWNGYNKANSDFSAAERNAVDSSSTMDERIMSYIQKPPPAKEDDMALWKELSKSKPPLKPPSSPSRSHIIPATPPIKTPTSPKSTMAYDSGSRTSPMIELRNKVFDSPLYSAISNSIEVKEKSIRSPTRSQNSEEGAYFELPRSGSTEKLSSVPIKEDLSQESSHEFPMDEYSPKRFSAFTKSSVGAVQNKANCVETQQVEENLQPVNIIQPSSPIKKQDEAGNLNHVDDSFLSIPWNDEYRENVAMSCDPVVCKNCEDFNSYISNVVDTKAVSSLFSTIIDGTSNIVKMLAEDNENNKSTPHARRRYRYDSFDEASDLVSVESEISYDYEIDDLSLHSRDEVEPPLQVIPGKNINAEQNVKELTQMILTGQTLEAVFHPNNSTQQAPFAVDIWLEKGVVLDTKIAMPKLMWRKTNPVNSAETTGVLSIPPTRGLDILDIIRVEWPDTEENALLVDRYPFAALEKCFIVQSGVSGRSFLFECRSARESKNIMNAWTQVIAKFSRSIVSYDPFFCSQYFELGDDEEIHETENIMQVKTRLLEPANMDHVTNLFMSSLQYSVAF